MGRKIDPADLPKTCKFCSKSGWVGNKVYCMYRCEIVKDDQEGMDCFKASEFVENLTLDELEKRM